MSNRHDCYSDSINAVCELYHIDRDVCIEYFWEEVEEYMKMKLMFNQHQIQLKKGE